MNTRAINSVTIKHRHLYKLPPQAKLLGDNYNVSEKATLNNFVSEK